jgi:hypothetical protein
MQSIRFGSKPPKLADIEPEGILTFILSILDSEMEMTTEMSASGLVRLSRRDR